MNVIYKYNPDDFSGMLNLTDDLSTFYKLHTEYTKERTRKKYTLS